MDKFEKEYYSQILSINSTWLINYMTDMIVENDDAFEEAIKFKDRDTVSSIIERYIY